MTLSTEELDALLGCYKTEAAAFEFREHLGQLQGYRKEWGEFRLFPESKYKFFMRNEPRYGFEFDLSNNRKVLKLEVHGKVHELVRSGSECET